MGFMGYKLVESDEAADMTSDVFKVMVKELRKNLRARTNEHNTDGVDNVSMFLTEVCLKQRKIMQAFGSDIQHLAIDCRRLLEKRLAKLKAPKVDPDWFKDDDYKRELKGYREYKKFLIRSISNMNRLEKVTQ